MKIYCKCALLYMVLAQNDERNGISKASGIPGENT